MFQYQHGLSSIVRSVKHHALNESISSSYEDVRTVKLCSCHSSLCPLFVPYFAFPFLIPLLPIHCLILIFFPSPQVGHCHGIRELLPLIALVAKVSASIKVHRSRNAQGATNPVNSPTFTIPSRTNQTIQVCRASSRSQKHGQLECCR